MTLSKPILSSKLVPTNILTKLHDRLIHRERTYFLIYTVFMLLLLVSIGSYRTYRLGLDRTWFGAPMPRRMPLVIARKPAWRQIYYSD